jgi:hypothetical protein
MYGQFANVYMNDQSLAATLLAAGMGDEEDQVDNKNNDSQEQGSSGRGHQRPTEVTTIFSKFFQHILEQISFFLKVVSSPALDPDAYSDERAAALLQAKLTSSAPIATRTSRHAEQQDALKQAREAMLSGSTADYASSLQLARSQAGMATKRFLPQSSLPPTAASFSYK